MKRGHHPLLGRQLTAAVWALGHMPGFPYREACLAIDGAFRARLERQFATLAAIRAHRLIHDPFPGGAILRERLLDWREARGVLASLSQLRRKCRDAADDEIRFLFKRFKPLNEFRHDGDKFGQILLGIFGSLRAFFHR